jgi:putative FmdB family regulatory protein
MPLYDYQCLHCQTIFEVRASFKEKEAGLKPECSHCHSQDVRQVIAAGLLLQIGEKGAAFNLPNCETNSGSGCCG